MHRNPLTLGHGTTALGKPVLHARPARCQRRAQGGVVMIEVLVAGLIFAFGVLGIVGLQAHLKRTEVTNKFRVQAMTVSNDLIGTMWGDPQNLNEFDTASGRCDGHALCASWKAKVARALPSGTAVVAVVPSAAPTVGGRVQIGVAWRTPDGNQRFDTETMVVLR